MIMSKKDIQEMTAYRSRIYSFLSLLFREEVTEEILIEMKNNVFSIMAKEEQIPEGVISLKDFLNLVEINHTLIESLASDYATLFLGFGKYPAHPYESVYLDKNNTTMSGLRNEVLEIYKNEGLQRAGWFKEPEDHIAIEFEFMSFLTLELHRALTKTNNSRVENMIQLQYSFYTKHLKSWVKDFCKDMIASRSLKHDFYRAIGKITEEFIREENSTIKGLLLMETVNG